MDWRRSYVYFLCIVCMFFFFFKQKTAYEMRISDWSSDVCSSDLLDQVVVADLKGGSNDVLTYSSAAAGVDGSIRTRNAEAQVNVRYEHQFSWNDDLADQDVISGLAKGRVSLARDALSLEGGAIDRKSTRLKSSH